MYNLNKKSKYKNVFLIFVLSFMFVFSRFNSAFCASEDTGTGNTDNTSTSTKSVSTVATNDNNVTIEITADKDNYSLRDTANFTVKLTNKNDYSVFVHDLNFGSELPDYIIEQIKEQLPEKLEAGYDKSSTVKANLGFSEFKDVKVGDEKIKVGLVASYDVVPMGSVFNVESIDSTHDSYETHLKNLDAQSNMQRVTFFDLTLKENNNEDAKPITEFKGYVKVYIQVPKGWDTKELQALFISTDKDEEFEETLETIDGVEYMTFTTNHFSPYAMFDPKELEELGFNPNDINGSNGFDDDYKTGHSDLKTILVLTGVAVVSLIIALVFSNKFRRTMLSIAIFLGTLGQVLVNDSSISHAAESTASTSSMTIKLETIGKSGSSTEDVKVTPSFSTSSYQDKDTTKCWAVFDKHKDTDDIKADVFFVAPTVHKDTTKTVNMSMSDATVRSAFKTAVDIQRGIYDDSEGNESLENYYPVSDGMDYTRRFFAPYYRQARFDTYFQSGGNEDYLKIAYSDVRDAFEYYLDNINPDSDSSGGGRKPIILAGFSQGADMCIRLLKEFHVELESDLVACYAIGWRYKKSDTADSGFDGFPIAGSTEGKDGKTETGCVISFNCEDGNINHTVIVPSTETGNLCVNPLTWKTSTTSNDFESAPTDNKSKSLFFDSSTGNVITNGKIEGLITKIKIASNRKTLALAFNEASTYSTIRSAIESYTKNFASLTPSHEGSYHTYDYQFFYGNLKQNVVDRLKEFLK